MRIETLREQTGDLIEELRTHRLYSLLREPDDLRSFMRTHVFCVWDFMTLLMSLRQRLGGSTLPWIPRGAPEDRRLLNEIVRDEESDEVPGGRVLSHFELYLEAMTAAGADRIPIDAVVASVARGSSLGAALASVTLPGGVRPFVETTMKLAAEAPLHAIAAVFFSSREAVIPPIFERILERTAEGQGPAWEPFRFYLRRHIEVDDSEHQHAAGRIVEHSCGRVPERWREAVAAAREALEARIALWNVLSDQLAQAGLAQSLSGEGGAAS